MKNHAIFYYKNYKNIAMTRHELPFFKVNIKCLPPSLSKICKVFLGKDNPNKYPNDPIPMSSAPMNTSKLIKYYCISALLQDMRVRIRSLNHL